MNLLCTALAVIIGLAAGPAMAQTEAYPSRSVTFIVGFPPGSSSDIFARTVGAKLAERLGKPFVI